MKTAKFRRKYCFAPRLNAKTPHTSGATGIIAKDTTANTKEVTSTGKDATNVYATSTSKSNTLLITREMNRRSFLTGTALGVMKAKKDIHALLRGRLRIAAVLP